MYVVYYGISQIVSSFRPDSPDDITSRTGIRDVTIMIGYFIRKQWIHHDYAN